ncbi:UNVERIFIED_CONTAM: hypothetical protein Slati_1374500 [Sesamum latifolium]|uniref:Retrotransposon gag domain-containing protein n=1 Tax=Sesamum latifolium TaxID=2727402 RepID=A0AAW2XIP5_9LAMI
MPRLSRTGKLEFDPEIEKTARRLQKETKQLKEEASTSSEFEAEQTIKEMTSFDLNQQPLCIEYPTLDVDFELKSGLIHLLPTFRDLASEDPHKHLKEFHVVCSGMRPQGVTEEQVKLRAFPFSLSKKAKDWLYSLPSGSIISWNELKKFKHLVESCPHHQIPDQLLIQYFYEGLSETNRSLVNAASGGNTQQVKACGICTSSGHATDACPTLQEEPTMNANIIGGFFGPSQKGYEAFSNTYNPGWRDHPNLRYCNQSQNFQKPPPPPQSNLNSESQVSQLASSVSRLKSRGKLPSQTIINPKQNISAITLCGEKELQFKNSTRRGHAQENRTENSVARGHAQHGKTEDENSVVRGHAEQGKTGEELEISPKQAEKFNQVREEHPKVFMPKPPFPERFDKSKKEEEEKDILETLRKVEVNIPLLNAIKQVPRYAMFLKEICTNKSKLRGNEWVSMGENISAILQRKLPPKCKDPGTFSIPCKIENVRIEKLCDLGASINIMPLAIYESLNVGPLKETGIVLQLADRSIVYPEGVLKDELVQVNELVFPVDFYVLDMIGDNCPNSTSILLGRPFLKTSKIKINVDAGILSIEFDNEVVSFNIGGVTQNFNDMQLIFLMDFIDPLVQGNAMFNGGGAFKMTINKSLTLSPRTYKNKAFHEKISSRKKSSMDRQVLLNLRHHRVHYIEEVDLECPTH